MCDEDIYLNKLKTVVSDAQKYFSDLCKMDEEYQVNREVSSRLPLLIDDLANAVDGFPRVEDQDVKSDFLAVALKLMKQEKKYDPNPGKTRYNVSYIRSQLPKLK